MVMSSNKIITTPRGVAKFCHLVKPSTKFNPEGVYSLSLLLEGEEASALIDKIEEAIQANLDEIRKELKNPRKQIKENDRPYKDDEDKDGNPTGKTLFVFKQKASATAKDGTKLTFKPALYDSRGNVIHPKDIGFGSVVRAAFEIVPYCNPSSGAGVQLRLRGVQIIELRTGELTAEALGFGIEEDGYVADETDETGTALAKAEAADGAPAPDESDF